MRFNTYRHESLNNLSMCTTTDGSSCKTYYTLSPNFPTIYEETVPAYIAYAVQSGRYEKWMSNKKITIE